MKSIRMVALAITALALSATTFAGDTPKKMANNKGNSLAGVNFSRIEIQPAVNPENLLLGAAIEKKLTDRGAMKSNDGLALIGTTTFVSSPTNSSLTASLYSSKDGIKIAGSSDYSEITKTSTTAKPDMQTLIDNVATKVVDDFERQMVKNGTPATNSGPRNGAGDGKPRN